MSLVRPPRRVGVRLLRRGAHRPAPEAEDLTDEEWADYLFYRRNTRGDHLEQWCHASGCRRYFNVRRDTVTYRIKSVYKPGEPPPGATG